MPQLIRRRRADPTVLLSKHTIGNALVVCPEQKMTEEARSLALAVAPDTENEMVVVDLPAGLPISTWDTVADLLPRRRRGVRLVLGGRSRETTALAGQWLSERLGRTVVAPDGVIFRGAGGTLFVDAGKGSGWVRFRPGRTPEWEAKRFPRPSWDSGVVDPMPTSAVGMAEPIPGGVWIHSVNNDIRSSGHWSRLARGMPCQPDVLSVVLGCPGTPPLSLDDVTRFWRRLSDQVREKVRFVQYGPVRLPEDDSLGQALADLLDVRVSCYTGMPVGSPSAPDIYTMCADGELGWKSFVREVAYLPKTHPSFQEMPTQLSHRIPVDGLEQISPAVYWYTPDAVVEVVQSGLWMRPPQDPENAAAVRTRQWNPDRNVLVFDSTDEKRAARMRLLSEDLLARLDPATRVRCRLLPASEAGREAPRVVGAARGEVEIDPEQANPRIAEEPGLPDAPADFMIPANETSVDVAVPIPVSAGIMSAGTVSSRPASRQGAAMPLRLESSSVSTAFEPSAHRQEAAAPTITGGAVPSDLVPPEPVLNAEPEPAPTATTAETPVVKPKSATRMQPTPKPEASALVSGQGLTEERAWLRRTLSREFDTLSHSISRILSEHPGFQGADSRSSTDVLTDTVAVRLYLLGQGEAIDQALRTAENGPHVPFARCVVAGLNRLPSHRGATAFQATPTAREWQLYRQRRLVTEWGFTNALTEPSPDQRGEVDVLVWSMTGRRTRLLEPDGADRAENRVVFSPGTSFKILELAEPQPGGVRGGIMLRELAESEVDETGRVNARVALDELAINSLRRCVERWSGAEPRGAVGESARRRFGALPGLV
ncbi:hypothetical protein [Saccharopolyspora sp. 5N708]|uniref:hypothetical protein n=1 Tax=Saccharopolyspora sp. 5N708 TaxID=3457424 RepID=UPI003FCFD1BD